MMYVCYGGLLIISYRIMDSLSSVFSKKSFLHYTNRLPTGKSYSKSAGFFV